jgi:hypothetical protein
VENDDKRIGSVVDQMAERCSRQGIIVDRAIFLNEVPTVTDILDPIIAWGIDLAGKMNIKDPAEKIFDKLLEKELAGEDDCTHAIGYLGVRFLDSMRYMTSIKKKYKGNPIEPEFTSVIAREILTKRGILKK